MKRLLLVLAVWLAMMGAAFAQININTATKEQLDGLKGIGPVKAQAIIDFRTKNGPFKTVDDLQKVTGIGAATMKDIRGDISVTGGGAPAKDAKADTKAEAKKADAKAPVKVDAKKDDKKADAKADAKKDDKAAKTDMKKDDKAAAKKDDKKAEAKKDDKAPKADVKKDDKAAAKKDDKKDAKKADAKADAKKDDKK